jgi:hypothetical protein
VESLQLNPSPSRSERKAGVLRSMLSYTLWFDANRRERGVDQPVEATRSWNAQGAGVEPLDPSGTLPGWADGDCSSSDDELDCHICRLTAEEMGEPLIVVCACTTLPVHHSCRETSLPRPMACSFARGRFAMRLRLTWVGAVHVRHRSGGVAGAMQEPCLCPPVPDLPRAVSASNFATCSKRGRRRGF